MSDLLDEPVITIAENVRAGNVSAVDVANACLARIAERDGAFHAFLWTSPDALMEQARDLDERRARGETLGPLAGVPIALKDALCTKHAPTTAGSKILEGYVPPYDATVVARLRAADALLAGKTNMDEFAMGSSNENSAYGPCRNPWDPERIPGGSSGGSAASVAARMTPAALGSDTGGSIRQPAALTGTVGVKPTYGRVSRYGLVAFASSLDQIGPIASDVRGAARVLDVIAGHDPKDATSREMPAPKCEAACEHKVRDVRVGVPEEYFGEGLDPDVEASVREAIAALEHEGCQIVPIQLPHTKYAVSTYYVVATAEASSNLARFDGVRYGVRADASDLRSLYGKTRSRGFGPEVKRRILLGTFVLSAGYYDAYYAKAQKVRTLLARDFDEAFSRVEAIVTPTSPTPAFRLGEKTNDPLAMYLSDVCTLPASLAGLPAISVPCKPTPSNLPVGVQLVGRANDESTLFALAAACERAFPPRPAIR
ncbi:MAG TPA: Asp-tRNA(Asn)/Glu-tRNA(Gln) amidotransferase subunit GatA [Polyangiaceae bacterium]|nr:Asp-tRNA(Asn)/Glu-tRNA(Gln) amidotransferase subunit GatA [Polyangiaceae bacterium]